MRITLLARGSGPDPYHVDFEIVDGSLRVYCDCRAGSFGKLCKHKTELLAGDSSRLHDQADLEKLRDMQAILESADQLKDVASSIAKAEKVIREKQKSIKQLKAEMAAILREGCPVQVD